MALKFERRLFERACAPDLGGAVFRCGYHFRSVGTESGGEHFPFVTRKYREAPASGSVPRARSFVRGGGRDPPSIGTKRRRENRILVSFEQSELIAVRRADFFEILRKEHELAVKLLWQFLGVLADRLDQTSRDLTTAREELAAEDITNEIFPDSEEGKNPFAVEESSSAR